MRRLRGIGLAISILAGLSGCTGFQHHLSWPSSHEVSETDDPSSHRLSWWKRPSADHSASSETDPAFAQTRQNSPAVVSDESSKDIWSERQQNEGLARYFPNTLRRWNRLTGRFHAESNVRIDEVPAQPDTQNQLERTVLNSASRDRQVRTVRMTVDGESDANLGPKPSASSGEPSALAPEARPSDSPSFAAAKIPVFYEPTSVGRPEPLATGELAPAQAVSTTQTPRISETATAPAATTLLAMNATPGDAPTPSADSMEAPPAPTTPPPAPTAANLSDQPESDTPRSDFIRPNDGSATAAIRRKLLGLQTAATDLPAQPSSKPVVATNPSSTPVSPETAPRIASVAAPASADVAPPKPATTVTSQAYAPNPSVVTAEPQSRAVASTSVPTGHNHLLLGWLCPLKNKPHQVLPSSQLPPLAYPTSYQSCVATKPAKPSQIHASAQSDRCDDSTAPGPKKPCFLKCLIHAKPQTALNGPHGSHQSELAPQPPVEKKPCFLKTWLHTSAQESLETPLASAQCTPAQHASAPKKPCVLKQWFDHVHAPSVFGSPQASPQSLAVVETAAVKNPCLLKGFIHKFDQPKSGCHCVGCQQGGSHCCCESQRTCGPKHHTTLPSAQSIVTNAPSAASPQAAVFANKKADDVIQASSRGAESNDIAEEGKLERTDAVSANNFDKPPQG